MRIRVWKILFVGLFFITGCISSRKFNPDKKYSTGQLKADYTLFRKILEENHPSLYWYTTKDSLDNYFDIGYARIKDSMKEPAFRALLSYVISKINCGHTTVRYSKKFTKYLDTVNRKQFPFSIKLWADTAVVYANLNHGDSILKRGTIIKAINQKPISFYRDSLFQFLSTDGYNSNHKYQTLSNQGAFGAWYRNVFGLTDTFSITYLDSVGQEEEARVPVYDPVLPKAKFPSFTKKDRKQLRLLPENNLQIDTAGSSALFTLATFSNGNSYKHLVKKTFRKLGKLHIKYLVIDVRNNGGGNVDNATLLTKYLIDRKFKVADSLYAINRKTRYGKYIKHNFLNQVFMVFMSRKRSDGNYHFGYFERHYFEPKRHHHFNGKVSLIIGGNSFSATTIFVNALKGQSNVTVIGEETGGGSYGNTAWLIPEARLPHTGIRFRVPKYRFVANKNLPRTGRGIYPDVEAGPNSRAIKAGIDLKLKKAWELISIQ